MLWCYDDNIMVVMIIMITMGIMSIMSIMVLNIILLWQDIYYYELVYY